MADSRSGTGRGRGKNVSKSERNRQSSDKLSDRDDDEIPDGRTTTNKGIPNDGIDGAIDTEQPSVFKILEGIMSTASTVSSMAAQCKSQLQNQSSSSKSGPSDSKNMFIVDNSTEQLVMDLTMKGYDLLQSIVNLKNNCIPTTDAGGVNEIEEIRRRRYLGASNFLSSNKKTTKKATSKAVTGKCHICGATETPEWRRGPDGKGTLCNACGLQYAKMQKRKKAARNSGVGEVVESAESRPTRAQNRAASTTASVFSDDVSSSSSISTSSGVVASTAESSTGSTYSSLPPYSTFNARLDGAPEPPPISNHPSYPYHPSLHHAPVIPNHHNHIPTYGTVSRPYAPTIIAPEHQVPTSRYHSHQPQPDRRQGFPQFLLHPATTSTPSPHLSSNPVGYIPDTPPHLSLTNSYHTSTITRNSHPHPNQDPSSSSGPGSSLQRTSTYPPSHRNMDPKKRKDYG
ncbi:hypothetical protein BKA69DRAFT_1122585 [Paraphysoderma sedebokerense]|nr:hypothetical protein BKA69DRAFT_1122585 [Paraphysoderma sedebokerense]